MRSASGGGIDTSSPAIPLIARERAPLLARPYLAGDEPSPLAGLMAHVPELLEATMPFIAAIYGPTALAPRLKELVILRVSVRNGCRYCTRVHDDVAAEAGVSEGERRALQAPETPLALEGRERAAVLFADAMCAAPGDAVAGLREFFRDDEIVELTMLAGATIFLNRFCTALGLR